MCSVVTIDVFYWLQVVGCILGIGLIMPKKVWWKREWWDVRAGDYECCGWMDGWVGWCALLLSNEVKYSLHWLPY